ncbi:hypothetical protein [Micromonospora endolithica]|uniref:Sensor domain-containing protein n=1 Tax=Micromonospora endolithica TaxID=230091 RepID=A0A3A9Z8A7_9ACTN|nr:hypothetical protein [Micromonospora endolithica]RKN44493.1 hypothetical protein D7223_19820 [Micromonospora endolithica]TWJ25999.1 hypothetical protein JD76_06177 [Micromonospora endolithica]
MLRMVLSRSVTVVAVCMVVACGSPTARPADRPAAETMGATGSATATASPAVPATGGPGYSATLSARLVTTDSLPPGFAVEIATVMPTDAGEQPSGVDGSCSDSMLPLLSATRLTGTPSAMAAATVSHDAGPAGLWVANEVLRTYADDGARRAMTDLRAFIDRCPTATSSRSGHRYRYATAPGPRLGDDSVHVSCGVASSSGTSRCDSILVRIGTALVVVQEQFNEPGGESSLTQLAEAALHRYQTTGP